MRDFLLKVFDSNLGGLEINLFDFWHVLYILIILGLTFGGAYLLTKKSEEKGKKVLDILVWLLVISYLSDFFTHEFVYDGLNTDKLPFHICTVLCPIVALTHFNKRLQKFAEPVAVLAIVGPLMYICYPGTALGEISPISYKVVQTFFYHGVLFAYGVLSLTTKKVEFKLKNIWKALVLICLIAVWATLGNFAYAHDDGTPWNWFFLRDAAFGFEFPYPITSLMVISGVFAMCLIIYGIYFATLKVISKIKAKQ